jgi:hypothetical protein
MQKKTMMTYSFFVLITFDEAVVTILYCKNERERNILVEYSHLKLYVIFQISLVIKQIIIKYMNFLKKKVNDINN